LFTTLVSAGGADGRRMLITGSASDSVLFAVALILIFKLATDFLLRFPRDLRFLLNDFETADFDRLRRRTWSNPFLLLAVSEFGVRSSLRNAVDTVLGRDSLRSDRLFGRTW
jgi:hypothetical protein